ncbi:MAG: protein translocase subunit SecF [Clostridia bacterium]|nr:protein translocase subunit SecF [Clostridia bacterium]
MNMKRFFKPALLISLAIILLALVLTLCGRGMNLGLDFAGGLSMPYDLGQIASQPDVAALLGSGYSVSIQGEGKNEALVRVKSVGAEDIQDVQAAVTKTLQSAYPNAAPTGDVSYVGPVAGATLVKNAVTSVLIASVLMLVYIAFRFDFHSGVAAVLALLHDVAIMLAFMVILRDLIELNSSFIAAALTIVGYSINDTIVVFDRIRENAKVKPELPKAELVSLSVRECLGRTIMTSVTTLVTILALYILGVPAIKEFALPIIVGVLAGTWSSNLISGYIWAWLEEKFPKKEKSSDEDDEDDDE